MNNSGKVFYAPTAMKLFIDGSCTKNPGGQGGCAGMLQFSEDSRLKPKKIFSRGYKKPTDSTRMELTALLFSYKYIKDNPRLFKNKEVIIVTDLKHAEVHQRWNVYVSRQKGWRCGDGRPASNSDLWKQIISAKNSLKKFIDIKWLRGKSTPILKKVDALAKQAAQNPFYIDYGYTPGKIRKSKSLNKGRPVPCDSKSLVVKIYRKKPIGNEYKIWFDVYSKIKKYYEYQCYAFLKKDLGRLSTRKCYKLSIESTNDTYPIIDNLEELSECPES